jgi:phage-related protein
MNWEIEFYKTESGREPVSDFIQSLKSVADQAQILRVLDLLLEHGLHLGNPYVRDVTGMRKLKELRIRSQSGIYRIFYFAFTGQKFVLLHAIAKKSQKTPKKDLRLAFQRMKDFLSRKGRASDEL